MEGKKFITFHYFIFMKLCIPYLPPIQTQAREFKIFRLLNKKLSDRLLVKKLDLIFEVLRSISAVFGTASVVQTINKSSLYGHLLPIKERKLSKSFSSDWPIIAKFLVYQVVEWTHSRSHGNMWMNYSISLVCIKATVAVVHLWLPPV